MDAKPENWANEQNLSSQGVLERILGEIEFGSFSSLYRKILTVLY